MEDIGLFRQMWHWVQSQKDTLSGARMTSSCIRDRIGMFMDRHWPVICSFCLKLAGFVVFLSIEWKNSFVRGCLSFAGFGPAALLLIMWSCFLSLTSISCLVYVLLNMGAAGLAVHYLGYTSGLFIVGLIAILILWMYANFWITGILFIVGGYLFSLNHARLVILMATVYGIYSVQVRAGWVGVILSINLAFLSNDMLNYLLKCSDTMSESASLYKKKESEKVPENDFPAESTFAEPVYGTEKVNFCKSSSTKPATSTIVDCKKKSVDSQMMGEETDSVQEIKRISSCKNHYEALGILRHKKIDIMLLKKEYRKKVMLVHPDKNMGSALANESFKKLQCAYEVLSDPMKKRDYDEQLRKEESKSVLCSPRGASHQVTREYYSEDSRRIQCTKCGNSHIWVCTNRSKVNARWCKDCCQYHQAKDGDGWVEYKGSLVFDMPQKMEIPRAFVCAESKIFDVSEWAICQGMACRPNTHRPSFHVNMVGLGKTTQRSSSSRFQWDLDAEMMDDEDEEFELWLQQALASGLFCESSKRRKSWSPFKLQKTMKQWRRTST
uniref:J domain-containing protein n=1 Tax=Kalanchoe fedtschenkoi TaxID=63787 RepID=A0A7N0UQ28_KALFE